MHFLNTLASSSLPAAGLFSFPALPAAGHTGAPPVHYGARLGPGGALPDVCSGRSMTLELAVLEGIGFRLAEPCRTIETHNSFLFFALLSTAVSVSCRLSSSLLGGSHGVFISCSC